jgi:RNA polymerase nonessential primary-like sigma factor
MQMNGDLDALTLFRQSMNTITPLGEEEEQQLIHALDEHRIQREKARNRLVEGYQPMLLSLAYRLHGQCRIVEILDLVQEGSLAVMLAADAYRQGEGDFRTYAYCWAKGAMIQCIAQQERGLRIPEKKLLLIRRWQRCQDQLRSELGREPLEGEIAVAMSLKLDQVREIERLNALQMLSLEMLMEQNEDIAIVESIRPAVTTLREFVARLPLRQRMLMTLRYDLDTGNIRSVKEVASELKLSPAVVEAMDRRIRLHLRRRLQGSHTA